MPFNYCFGIFYIMLLVIPFFGEMGHSSLWIYYMAEPVGLLKYYLSGRPIIVDFSPVTDFREATCRQYEENVCNRGGYCNFMHLKKISR